MPDLGNLRKAWKPPQQPCDRKAMVACCTLFVVVAYLSLWLLNGDQGFWNDDFYLRDAWLAKCGGIVALPSPTPFDNATSAPWLWRPALTVGVTTMVGGLWRSPQLVHAILALLHVTTAIQVGVFLRTCNRTRAVCFASSLLYLSLPQHFEVAFWANGFLVGVGTGLLLVVAMLYMAWARGRRSLWMLALLCIGALVVACTHEQPAGMFIAFPFLFFASRPPAERMTKSFVAMLLPLILMASAIVAYILLQLGRQADGGVGGSGMLLPPSRWGSQSIKRTLEALREVGPDGVGWGGLRMGLTTVRDHGAATAIAAILAIVVFVLIVRAWLPNASAARNSYLSQSLTSPQLFASIECRRIALAFAGLIMALGSLIPLSMVELSIRPRMLSPVLVGLIIFLAPIADQVLFRASQSNSLQRSAKIAFMCVVGLITLAGTLCMIGAQRGFQLRWHGTQQLIQAMRAKLPDPGPNAVLMPVRCDDWPVQSGIMRFDNYFTGPFYWSYGFASMGRIVYGRNDIDCSFVHRDITLAFVTSPTHALRHGPFRAGFTQDTPSDAEALLAAAGWTEKNLPRTVVWVAWDRVVPFVSRPDGGVDFVTTLAFRKGGSQGEVVLEVPMTRTQHASCASAFHELRWIIDLPEPPKRSATR